MALSTSTTWEVRSTGNSANGGGFNVGNTNFATDLTATSGTGTAPVVSSASYTFVAGDVGAMVFVKAGTNWTPGFYPIASVSAGAATLTASIGSVVLFGGATVLNTAAGVATTASPTAGTWGVDYSQQNSPQITFTDMVIDGTTATKFTSAAFPVGKNFVGNLINVTSGTGFTVQRVEVVSTVTTTATCDKSLGTLSSTGGNGKLGGCLSSPADAATATSGLNSNRVFIKGSHTITASVSWAGGSLVPTAATPPNWITGYSVYRGDGVRATITCATNTGITAFSLTTSGYVVENFEINCASLGTSRGISNAAFNYTTILNCKVSGFTSFGVLLLGSNGLIDGCEVTAGTSAATAAVSTGSNLPQVVRRCNVHDNACPGVSIQQGTVEECLVTNNTGASSDGIAIGTGTACILRNTVHGSGRHGVFMSTSQGPSISLLKGNLLTSSGGYGMAVTSAGWPARSIADGNAYWNNTSGTRNNLDDRGTTNPAAGIAPYVNTLDVALTADPYTAKASDDYRLNTTAGGGAACRGFGVPTTWPGNTLTVGAPDMGAVQHVDSGGSGGPVGTNFRGGFSNG